MGKRAIVVVLDGCGAGAAPDAVRFGDTHGSSTLLHVWNAVGGFDAPNLGRLGLLAAAGIPVSPDGSAAYGRLEPMSQGGKDSVTGHWEMAGIVMEERFPTYPDGFPDEVVQPFEAAIGVSVIGNRPASGTAILDELGAEHLRTGCPILYTSADSVFQVAAHKSVMSTERLYEVCEVARAQLVAPHAVQRVIARPFAGEPEAFRRTEFRKDWPLVPPRNLCDQLGDVHGIGVVPELFGGRGFRSVPRTQSNGEHGVALLDALSGDARMIWANFEDFDMKFGHRSDTSGFAKCLEEFDRYLSDFLPRLGPEDMVIFTADHGNDPTDASTDHTREFVPVVVLGGGWGGSPLGDQKGFRFIADAVRKHLGLRSE